MLKVDEGHAALSTIANFTYVDNSNLYLEGRRVSAVRKGLPGATTIIDAMNNRVLDMTWQIDYGRLHEFACGDPATRYAGTNHRIRGQRRGGQICSPHPTRTDPLGS